MKLLTKQQAGDALGGISGDAAYRLAVRKVLKFGPKMGHERFITAASVEAEQQRRAALGDKRPGRPAKKKSEILQNTP